MRLLSDVEVLGKKVLLRADLDVDISNLKSQTSKPSKSVRLQNLKPTVDWLLGHGVKQVFIAGHIGRPQKRDPAFSTRFLEVPLEEMFRRSVTYKKDFNVEDGMLSSMAQLILFENLRFWPEEEQNNSEFAQGLSTLADIYVNDAFAVCHRAHASIVGVPAFLPHAAGLHLQEEVETLSKLLEKPQKPLVAIVGGAKIETKIPVIENLAKIANKVLIGGYLPIEIKKEGLILPKNVLIATLGEDKKDIDEASIKKFSDEIQDAKTVVWNGPMGLYEEGFEKGTLAVAQALIDCAGYTVVGGGETSDFLASYDLLDKFSFISSGGGAMLEFLSGKELPGIKALE